MLFALGSQFEKDSNRLDSKILDSVRCGFEAEFAADISYEDCANYLRGHLTDITGTIKTPGSYGASHSGSYSNWSVESDSTIPRADGYYTKVEIVSPIQGLDKTIADLSVVFDLIQNNGYTSQGTGLHMTFSLKDVDLHIAKFDHLKFLFLVGEGYYAEFFGRVDYGYAREFIARFQRKLSAQLRHETADENNDKGKKQSLVSITPTDCARFIELHSTAPSRIPSLVNESAGVCALYEAYTETVQDVQDRYQSINQDHLTEGDASRIEFRLPGGAGYENKFDVCSRLMRILANALWVSREGMSEYNDYYTKKFTRLVMAAQVEARSKGPDAEDVKSSSKFQTYQEGRDVVYQVTRFEKAPQQVPQTLNVATLVFTGNRLKKIAVTSDLFEKEGAALEEMFDKLSVPQFWSFFGELHNAQGNLEISRPSLSGPARQDLAECAVRSAHCPSIITNSVPDWGALVGCVDAIGKLSGKDRSRAADFVLHFVVMTKFDFARDSGCFPPDDSGFKAIGQLVKWANVLGDMPDKELDFYKFWVWAKADNSRSYTKEDQSFFDAIRTRYTLSLGAQYLTTTDAAVKPQSAKDFNYMLSLKRYRNVTRSISDLAVVQLQPSDVYELYSNGALSLRHFELSKEVLISLIPVVHKELDFWVTLYEDLSKEQFKQFVIEYIGPTAKGDISTINANSLKIPQGVPGSFYATISKIVSDSLGSTIKENAQSTSVDVLEYYEGTPVLSVAKAYYLISDVTTDDLKDFTDSSVIALRLAVGAKQMVRAGIKLPVNKDLAAAYLRNPAWLAALTVVAASEEISPWLFGIKPTSFLREVFKNASTLLPYIKKSLECLKSDFGRSSIDFCSLLQSVHPLGPIDINIAFGKDALDFLLKIVATGLMKGPFGQKNNFYSFNRYAFSSYKGVLPPVLDYLAGQEVKHPRTTINKTNINFIAPAYRYGDYEGSELGPYSTLKVSREDVAAWQSDMAKRLVKQPLGYSDAVDDPAIEEKPSTVPALVLSHIQNYHTTGSTRAFSSEDVSTFVGSASKEELAQFFIDLAKNEGVYSSYFTDFLNLLNTTSNSNAWLALKGVHDTDVQGVAPSPTWRLLISAFVQVVRQVFIPLTQIRDFAIPETIFGVSYSVVLHDVVSWMAASTDITLPGSMSSITTWSEISRNNSSVYRVLHGSSMVQALRNRMRIAYSHLKDASDEKIDKQNQRYVLGAFIEPVLCREKERSPVSDYLLTLAGMSKVSKIAKSLSDAHKADDRNPPVIYPWRAVFA